MFSNREQLDQCSYVTLFIHLGMQKSGWTLDLVQIQLNSCKNKNNIPRIEWFESGYWVPCHEQRIFSLHTDKLLIRYSQRPSNCYAVHFISFFLTHFKSIEWKVSLKWPSKNVLSKFYSSKINQKPFIQNSFENSFRVSRLPQTF